MSARPSPRPRALGENAHVVDRRRSHRRRRAPRGRRRSLRRGRRSGGRRRRAPTRATPRRTADRGSSASSPPPRAPARPRRGGDRAPSSAAASRPGSRAPSSRRPSASSGRSDQHPTSRTPASRARRTAASRSAAGSGKASTASPWPRKRVTLSSIDPLPAAAEPGAVTRSCVGEHSANDTPAARPKGLLTPKPGNESLGSIDAGDDPRWLRSAGLARRPRLQQLRASPRSRLRPAPSSTQRWLRGSPSSTRPTSTAAVRASAFSATRSRGGGPGRPRDEVRDGDAGRKRRPARVTRLPARCGRGLARAARQGDHRPPLLPPPRRGDADRGDGRGDGRAHRRRKGAVARPLQRRRRLVRRGVAAGRVVAVQNQYSLVHRNDDETVLPVCRELGIGYIPYFPLESGLLTGKYRRGAPAPEGTRLAGTDDGRLSDERLAAGGGARGIRDRAWSHAARPRGRWARLDPRRRERDRRSHEAGAGRGQCRRRCVGAVADELDA